MQVVYEDNRFKICKSLIFTHNADFQRLVRLGQKQQNLQNYCRRVVGRPETNRFVVGKNMVVYEIESDYPTS